MPKKLAENEVYVIYHSVPYQGGAVIGVTYDLAIAQEIVNTSYSEDRYGTLEWKNNYHATDNSRTYRIQRVPIDEAFTHHIG